MVETSLLVFTPLVQTSLSDSIIKSAQEPQKSHARWAIRRREPHARHRAALLGLKRSQTSATEKTGTPASRADWPTYCEIFRPQSVGYLPALGVSPAHLMWGLTVTDWRAYLTILGQFT